jgi:hypothetical protein
MTRFICRNYGPSRQVAYKGQQLCLSHDQVIETNDADEAAVLGAEKMITVTDRGEEFAAPPVPHKEVEKKERKVTVNDAEAVHDEKFPLDEDEQQREKSEAPTQPQVTTEDKDEIAYAEMSVKELQVLAKDRQLKTSGLKKDELIKALEVYDLEE